MSKVQLHAYAVIVLLVLIAVGVKAAKPFQSDGPIKTDFSKIPLHFGEWTGEERPFDDVTRRNLPNASLLMRFYSRPYDLAPVGLAIVYGTDLGDFHQPEVCLEGQGLKAVSKSIVQVTASNGKTFDAVCLITERDYSRQVFLFWFNTEGMTSTSLGRYKVDILIDRMFMRRIRPSAMIRLSTAVVTSEQDATDQLVQFAGEVFPYLAEEFRSTSSEGR